MVSSGLLHHPVVTPVQVKSTDKSYRHVAMSSTADKQAF